MIIQPKLTKKDIMKKVQDSTESNVYIYEPITTYQLLWSETNDLSMNNY